MIKFVIFISEWWLKVTTKILVSLKEDSAHKKTLKRKKEELHKNVCKIKELIDDKRIDKSIGSNNSERNSIHIHNL